MASGIKIDNLWINPDHLAQCEFFSSTDDTRDTIVLRFSKGGPDRVLKGKEAFELWQCLSVYHTANRSTVHTRQTLLLDPDPLETIRTPGYAENPETLNR